MQGAERRSGEDRSVDSGESWLERMTDPCGRIDRGFNARAETAQLGQMREIERRSHRFGVDNRVEDATEGDVGANASSTNPVAPNRAPYSAVTAWCFRHSAITPARL